MRIVGRVLLLIAVAGTGCGRNPSTPAPSAHSATRTEETTPVSTSDVDWPPLPVAQTPYLNTGAAATEVGSDACRRCHTDAANTYHHTAMAVSMLPVDIDAEPPDGTYDHPASARRYTIERREGQMWHIEAKLTAGTPVVLSEFPVKYVVGSGRHSRSYLVEADGFLVESPITWYSGPKQWGMSPGYDRPNHLGFERATGQGCLECHAGRTAPIGKSLHRMEVFEAAIGCERCHGPGSLHLKKHEGFDPLSATIVASGTDRTIVNPAHLSRELSEAICQQCHLRSNATIVARGHRLSDFRPGLPLTQVRHDYRLEVPDTPLTVVSHVEQMHLSRCYQQTETMSCCTCHNPHAEQNVERHPQHFNAICASCHAEHGCHATAAARAATTPADNCIHCHMPRGKTEIPHLAFTHHRITRHALAEADSTDPESIPQELGALRPLFSLSDWSKEDRQRSIGLAYMELSQRLGESPVAKTYRDRAFALLLELHNRGLADPAVATALARLAFLQESPMAQAFAREALADATLAGQDRCNVLFLLGDAALHQQQPGAALPFIQELTTLRRHPVDWLMRAQAERAFGQDPIASLEAAVRIAPQRADIHSILADHYTRAGETAQAEKHRRLAAKP